LQARPSSLLSKLSRYMPRGGFKRETSYRILVVIISLTFSAILAELVLRLFFADRVLFVQDEKNTVFRYDRELGWFPIENSVSTFTDSRTIQIQHNTMGFRDREHRAGTKPRLLFLGDSFVWGYDVEQHERFTDLLAERLPDWDIINVGVAGYSTDQEYLLLQKFLARFDPDIVFLVFCTDNDMLDDSSNGVFNGDYYKPYFEIIGETLLLKGIPVPKSMQYVYAEHRNLSRFYFLRATVRLYYKIFGEPILTTTDPTLKIIAQVRRFVEDRRAVFLVGLQKPQATLEGFLEDQAIPYVHLDNPHVYPKEAGSHWTPRGNAFVSDTLYEFLHQGKYLDRKRAHSGEEREGSVKRTSGR